MDVYNYDNISPNTLVIGGYTIESQREVVSNGSPIAVLEAAVDGITLQKSVNGVVQNNNIRGSSASQTSFQALISGNARLGPNVLTFGSTDGWTSRFGGSTLAYGTTKLFRSTQSMTLTTPHADGIQRTLSTPITIMAGAIIQFAIWFPESVADNGSPPSIQLRLSSDGGATKHFTYLFQPTKFRTGGWVVLTVKAGEDGSTDYGDGNTSTNQAAWAGVGGEAWGNAFNYVDIRINNMAATPVYPDSLAIGVKDVPRVVWTFDNINGTNLLDIIAPSLAQYGWSAAVMMDSDLIAGNISTIRTLRDTYGWEIGSMGGPGHINYNTTPGSGSSARLATDLPLVYAAHSAAGLARPTSFAYPSNIHNAACDTLLASEGFTWRRSRGVDIIPNGGGSSIPNALNNLQRSGYSSLVNTTGAPGGNLALTKARVDALCQGSGGVLSLFTHLASLDSTAYLNLGCDLVSWYGLIDYLGQMKRTYGLECIKPNEVGTKLSLVRRF